MAADPNNSEGSLEQRRTAAFVLGTGSFGFLFLGVVALLVSPPYHHSWTGDELVAAGAVGMALGIFLGVAVAALWFNKGWLGRWSE